MRLIGWPTYSQVIAQDLMFLIVAIFDCLRFVSFNLSGTAKPFSSIQLSMDLMGSGSPRIARLSFGAFQ